jgi:hypothetical protein
MKQRFFLLSLFIAFRKEGSGIDFSTNYLYLTADLVLF